MYSHVQVRRDEAFSFCIGIQVRIGEKNRMTIEQKRKILYLGTLFLGILIWACLISMTDLGRLVDIAQGVNPEWILLGTASAIVSFGAFGLSFVAVIWRLMRPSGLFQHSQNRLCLLYLQRIVRFCRIERVRNPKCPLVLPWNILSGNTRL
jgi:hypothetical protein